MFSLVVLVCVGALLGSCTSDSTDEQLSTIGSLSSGATDLYEASSTEQTETRQYYGNLEGHKPPYNKKRCPLCDSSVYAYCGEKLLHDACCCSDPLIHDLPYQCKLADCRFLHANSCREHRLIANCCCSDDYRSLLKSFNLNNLKT